MTQSNFRKAAHAIRIERRKATTQKRRRLRRLKRMFTVLAHVSTAKA